MVERFAIGNRENEISTSSVRHRNISIAGNGHRATTHTSSAGYTYSPATQNPGVFVSLPTTLLETCHSYALDRGNGIYTRLIPADQLPTLEGIPKTQGPDGFIILPQPGPFSCMGGFPDAYLGPGSPVIASDHSQLTPVEQDEDQNQRPEVQPLMPNFTFNGIPTISIANRKPKSMINDSVTGKRDQTVQISKVKVYCSKWVHSGTCAFTQRGCLYKHEMPMDRATQMEIGLFNGIPQWYKRYQQRQNADTKMNVHEENNSGHDGRRNGSNGRNISQRRGRGSQLSTRGPWLYAPSSSSELPITFAPAFRTAPLATYYATVNVSGRYIKSGNVNQQGSTQVHNANPYGSLSNFLEGDE